MLAVMPLIAGWIGLMSTFDSSGTITDGTTAVTQAETVTDAENPGVNRGHGFFWLTPKPGAKYFLQIATPAGIVPPTPEGFALPVAKADGIALTALDAVTPRGGAVRVKVQTAHGPKTLHVGAYVRERLIAQQKVTVQANTPLEVSLKGDEATGGVTRVTVFEEAQGEEVLAVIVEERGGAVARVVADRREEVERRHGGVHEIGERGAGVRGAVGDALAGRRLPEVIEREELAHGGAVAGPLARAAAGEVALEGREQEPFEPVVARERDPLVRGRELAARREPEQHGGAQE